MVASKAPWRKTGDAKEKSRSMDNKRIAISRMPFAHLILSDPMATCMYDIHTPVFCSLYIHTHLEQLGLFPVDLPEASMMCLQMQPIMAT